MNKYRFFISRLRRRLHPTLLAAVMILVALQIVVLSPGSLETEDTDWDEPIALEPTQIILEALAERPIIAPGIPEDEIPDYSIRGFDYISVSDGRRQWKLQASKANQYNSSKLIHARGVTAFLYNPDDEPTIVRAKEAKYFLNDRDLEVFGEVVTIFPDGFTVYSDYLHYRPNERKLDIPVTYRVRGNGTMDDEKRISFTSMGMDYDMNRNFVVLPRSVEFTMNRIGPKGPKSSGVADFTTIRSDHCEIDRTAQTAKFRMYPSRPLDRRFVRMEQPSLFMRSRTIRLNYGTFENVLRYLTANDDVFIEETDHDEHLRYATCGQADFDTTSDLIVLTKFPQVYQDNDTVTGEVILIHRDRDIVEVEHSNAFSEGERTSHK